MTPRAWQLHVKDVLERRDRFQFGQPPATCRLVTDETPGDVACTDTCIQLITLMVTGKRVSLDKVRRLSRGPRDGSRGLRPEEALRALRLLGLEYDTRDLSPREVMSAIRSHGPVIIAEAYWAHPQWQGYVYGGQELDGRTRYQGEVVRVGFAAPRGEAGLTQPTFRDGHAVLGAWATAERVGIRDPNHNSATRPERPAFDIVTPRQLDRMLDSIRDLNGGQRLVYVPTRRVF